MMKVSRLDIIPAFFIAAFSVALVTLLLNYNSLSVTERCASGLVLMWFFNWAWNSSVHNFIHFEFFNNKFLNHVFYYLNTVIMLYPYTLYQAVHFVHHKFNNDLPDENGVCKDWMSIYDGGKNGAPVSVWTFAGAGPIFSLNYRKKFAQAKQFFESTKTSYKYNQAKRELIFLTAFHAACLLINYKFYFQFLVPFNLIGWAVIGIQGHTEHYGTKPEVGSVNCHNKLFNFLHMNGGYHAEHHYRPVHWTKSKELTGKMIDALGKPPVVRISYMIGAFLPRIPWSGPADSKDTRRSA